MSSAETAPSVAIIMDGNARWARQRDTSILAGHRAGAMTLKETVKSAVRLGIAELAVYAFSTENWNRPQAEVEGLMDMFAEMLDTQTPELKEEGVRIGFLGRRQEISERLLDRMEWSAAQTADNDRMRLWIAFNYGGRAEILEAAERYRGGGEQAFSALMYAPEMRDPDIVIRTSGEHRLSNFLLWQTAYAELFFFDVLWPEFGEQHLQTALEQYAHRQRRFGTR